MGRRLIAGKEWFFNGKGDRFGIGKGGKCLFELFWRECFAMQSFFVCKERNAFAFDGFCNDNGRSCAFVGCALVGAKKLMDVMSVHKDCLPAECGKKFFVFPNSMSVHRLVALAEAVCVEDCAEGVELVVCGELCCFVDLSFAAFAVAKEDIRARTSFLDARCERHADADGKSLAERAGCGFNPGKCGKGMAGECAVVLAKGRKIISDASCAFQDCVEDGCGVSFGKDEFVIFRIVCVVRCIPHGCEEGCDNFCARKAAGRVSGSCARGHGENVASQQMCEILE